MTEYLFDPSQWVTKVEGIPAWLRPWRNCPCGSSEHQEGGHPLDQLTLTAFYAERSEAERRYARVVRRWELKHARSVAGEHGASKPRDERSV